MSKMTLTKQQIRVVSIDALRVLFEWEHDAELVRRLYGAGSYSSGCDEIERLGVTDHAGQWLCDDATRALLRAEFDWRLSRNSEAAVTRGYELVAMSREAR